MDPALLREASLAVDEVLSSLGFPARELVEKASPLTPAGFDAVVLGLLKQIREVAAGRDKRAVEAALKKLDRDWAKMTAEARSDAVRDAARTFLGLTEDVAPEVADALRNRGVGIVAATKAAAAAQFRFRVEPVFDGVDQRILDAAANHQALFVRDQYGVRAAALSQTARSVVARGLEEGLDRYAIAEELGTALNASSVVRADSYWRVIADAFAARSRSWGTLRSFDEAGITRYQVHAVLDEVTTEICRFLDGKTFETGAGIARFEEVAASSDPEQVKELQPWGYAAKGDDGQLALFYKSGGERRPIARVDSPAFGKKDAVGSYSAAMNEAQLAGAGFHSPPYHGHCRTTVLPLFEAVSVPTVAPPFFGPGGAEPPVGKPAKPKVSPRKDPVPPPRWFVSAPPLPGGLPEFADAGGAPQDTSYLSAARKKALAALYAERPEDVGQKLGSLADPVGDDFDHAGYETALRSALGGRVLDLEKLAAKWGDVGLVSEKVLPKLSPLRPVDRDAVAGHVAGGSTGELVLEPKDKKEVKRLPVVVRWRGRSIVEAGAEKIVAEQLRAAEYGGSPVYVRFVDLDKAVPKPKLDARERVRLAGQLGAALKEFEGLTAGSPLPDDLQRRTREAVRDLLRSHGVETRDDSVHRHGAYATLQAFVDKPGANAVQSVRVEDMIKDAVAVHRWDGTVVVRHVDAVAAGGGTRSLARDPASVARSRLVAESELEEVLTLVHEELHGASKLRSKAYVGAGIGIEEAATEILARKVVRELADNEDAFQIHDAQTTIGGRITDIAPPYSGSYTRYIRTLVVETAKVAGTDGVRKRVEDALLATRRWDGKGNQGWDSPEEQIQAYVDALEIPDRKKAKALFDALSGPTSGLRP